jgi:hypothetical protein
MLGPGQLSRFRMFCKKKYRCVGRPRQKAELIVIFTAFLSAVAVKMSQPIRFVE